MNPQYKPVNIFNHPLKIDGCQVYYHAGREEYAIERDNRHLVEMSELERTILDHALAWEKAELDAADALDDDGKGVARAELY